MKPKLLLVDSSSYIFRAFFAVKTGLTNPAGVPTNALFGFKQMLLHLLQAEKPTHIAMVFDTPGGSFRNRLYPLYKANRSAPPEELIPQFPLIFRLTELLNLPILKLDDYEADDLIGSLAHRFSSEAEVVIISGDKDLTQLINDQVVMLDTMKDFRYGPAEVKAKFGVGPEKIVEYLALMGDSSDNIPGAVGIGPKTAVKLFEKYGSIEGIYANIDQLKGKQKENLEAFKEQVALSKQLTQVVLDLDLPVSLDDLALKPPQQEPLIAFYQEMNFRPDAFVHAAIEEEGPVDEWDYSRYRAITTDLDLQNLLAELQNQAQLSLDFETTSLLGVEAQIVGISFAWKGGDPVYIPTGHSTGEQLALNQVLAALKPLFADPQKTWIGQNLKYELLVLANYGLDLAGKLEDSMIQSYLLDANSHRHNLDELSRIHLGHEMIHFTDLCGKGKKQIPFAQVGLEQALHYAAEDAEAALKIQEILSPRLKEEQLTELYQEMEIPLVRCLAHLEHEGVRLDLPYLEQLKAELSEDRDALEQAVYEITGETFNLNSTQQLGEILFQKMGITEALKKTKTGFSTDASVLEALAPKYEIARLLLEHRGKTKLLNTYLEPLPNLVSEKTGRVHTSFNQVVAATGRLSSQNPNLQNIPIKGQDGKKIRKAFIPAEGCKLVSADYSQVELRFLAHLSDDPGLLEVFAQGGDIHRQTAAAIFNLRPEQVSLDQRRAAKAINFGIIYGMGAYRLAKEINVSNKEAKNFIEAYFARYPKIKSYMDESVAMAKNQGFITTLFGRKRKIEGLHSKNRMIRQGAERVAINSRIQGSAADLIKRAMILLDQEFAQFGPKNRMILQVHDELVFEIEEARLDELIPMIQQRMQGAAKLKVPLLVEVGYGSNWGEAH